MTIAALTMVFNERHFLPIWVHHYGRQLGAGNLYVVDDGSDDGSTRGLGEVNVLRRPKAVLDEARRAQEMSDIAGQLLTRHDAVIVTDVDELLVPDPALGLSLPDYVATRVPSHATTTGLNVHFDLNSDGPLDLALPLFRQRRYVQYDWAYCKTPLTRVPLRWQAGFHSTSAPSAPRRDLLLFHLRAVDPAIALGRLRSLNRVEISPDTLQRGQAGQFTMDETAYLSTFFFTNPTLFADATPEADFEARLDAFLAEFHNWNRERHSETWRHLLRLPERFADAIQLPG